jgi:hypothetical protein
VREVLEKMFFVDVLDPAPGEALAAPLTAKLSFDGNPSGSFRLILDQTAARSAAADFLGEDPAALTQEQLNGVICELANMICGSVLSRIESSATFRLSTPTMVPDKEPSRPPMAAAFQAAVGGGIVRAEIGMERAACSASNAFAS